MKLNPAGWALSPIDYEASWPGHGVHAHGMHPQGPVRQKLPPAFPARKDAREVRGRSVAPPGLATTMWGELRGAGRAPKAADVPGGGWEGWAARLAVDSEGRRAGLAQPGRHAGDGGRGSGM